MKDREGHPSPLIGRRARVTNRYPKRYGQIGTIVGVQSYPEEDSSGSIDFKDRVPETEMIEADPNAEFQWEEEDPERL